MSFQQGLSGLNAASKNLEVIGNNIANSGTYGAKASRAEFADMYAASLNSAGGLNVGIGVNLAAVTQRFTQGNITTTENPLDLAINGNGFFEMLDPSGQTYYSRNGQFQQDRSGYIVNAQGQKLKGYSADSTGTIIPGQSRALQIPTGAVAPKQTTDISVEMNLQSDALLPTNATFDPADPHSYSDARSVEVYDAQGKAISMTYYTVKTSTPDTWDLHVTADGVDVPVDPNTGATVTQLTFSSDGKTLTSTSPVVLSLTSMTPAPNIGDINFDLSKMTQLAQGFGVTDQTQNGYAPGTLARVTVDDSGIVTANYSNGQSKAVGQVEFATFRNPQALRPLGGNAWASTYASGDAITGVPGSGNLGSMQAGALEESNVDLTAELVNMMTAQRVYQANSQTIKTQDQMMQTLLQMR